MKGFRECVLKLQHRYPWVEFNEDICKLFYDKGYDDAIKKQAQLTKAEILKFNIDIFN